MQSKKGGKGVGGGELKKPLGETYLVGREGGGGFRNTHIARGLSVHLR